MQTSPKIEITPSVAFILRLVETNARTKKDLFLVQREIAKKYNLGFQNKDALIDAYRKLVSGDHIQPSKDIESLIRMKNTRSLSGIVVVSVLTKPYACPGQCLYCPTQSDVPKSYLNDEPAVMRAMACEYDPYKQVTTRLSALHETGHPIDKINIRIIGGTWSYYPSEYQEWFISELFRACNDFQPQMDNRRTDKQTTDITTPQPLLQKEGRVSHLSSVSPSSIHDLDTLQQTNETSHCRIVEISIETRQDYITQDEIHRLRQFGVTKVELGVQSIFDDVLEINHRGNLDIDTVEATKLLRDTGFKVSYQIMPNLPGSNLERDEKMFDELFSNPNYKPDYLKIYPLALVKEAPVYNLYKEHNFKPYTKDELVKLLKQIKSKMPRYCRIERVIRDIPSPNIVEGGAKHSNLRQVVLEEMAKENLTCNCIRCREVREDIENPQNATLFREDYVASDGHEIFLTIESPDRRSLYSLLRLRIPSVTTLSNQIFPCLKDAALIREIHTYGRQLSIGQNDSSAAQHQGFGKRLIQEAENIAKEEFKLKKIAVISGVGVRQYFKKQNYELKDTYMVKNLN